MATTRKHGEGTVSAQPATERDLRRWRSLVFTQGGASRLGQKAKTTFFAQPARARGGGRALGAS